MTEILLFHKGILRLADLDVWEKIPIKNGRYVH